MLIAWHGRQQLPVVARSGNAERCALTLKSRSLKKDQGMQIVSVGPKYPAILPKDTGPVEPQTIRHQCTFCGAVLQIPKPKPKRSKKSPGPTIIMAPHSVGNVRRSTESRTATRRAISQDHIDEVTFSSHPQLSRGLSNYWAAGGTGVADILQNICKQCRGASPTPRTTIK